MTRQIASFLALVVVLIVADLAHAQRNATTYQTLLTRTRQANTYIDVNASPKPGNIDSSIVRTFFRLEFDYLNFTRSAAESDPDAEFGTEVTIFVDVFKAGANISDRTEQPDMAMMRSGMAQRRQNPSTNPSAGLSAIPLATDAWRGTAKAANYAQTISNRHYLEGFVEIGLPAGDYIFAVSMREEGQSRIRPVARARYRVHDFSNLDNRLPIYVIKSAIDSTSDKFQFLGFGNQVPYGSDFDVLIPIAESVDPNNMSLIVKALEFGRKDTSVTQTLATIETEPEMVVVGNMKFGAGYLFQLESSGQRWLRVPVMASRFPNAPMRIELMADGNSSPIGQRMLQSKWVDIPTSLLNVSVAVDMMESILEKDEFRRVRRLNNNEKETYFTEYWTPKDPTPGTEFNELMVEYYRRVDIAYERFSSATTPGFASDQGKTYILMGEPDKITRRFPPDQPVLEVWEYGERQILFQATSGFGDFQLVRSSK
jgi:GWxTD domain-containing protein